MPQTHQDAGLEQELRQALDRLQESLRRANDAAEALRALAPRINAISAIFDQIEAAVREGRRQIGGAAAAIDDRAQAGGYARPTLVLPSAAAGKTIDGVGNPAPALSGEPAVASTRGSPAAAEHFSNTPTTHSDELACFRLEFESHPGPLDLHAVDEAISEHHAVHDVALLDYDGHKATLKVWIDSSASPADVQAAIKDQARCLFSGANDVTVVALEDAV